VVQLQGLVPAGPAAIDAPSAVPGEHAGPQVGAVEGTCWYSFPWMSGLRRTWGSKTAVSTCTPLLGRSLASLRTQVRVGKPLSPTSPTARSLLSQWERGKG
jgi:hypothetical protein